MTRRDAFRRGFIEGWRWHPFFRGIGMLIGLAIVYTWWRPMIWQAVFVAAVFVAVGSWIAGRDLGGGK